MAARSIQISLDEDLLRKVNAQPETKSSGRSAFIRMALEAFLQRRSRLKIDQAYAKAYGGKSDKVWDEFGDLVGSQAWPKE